MSYNGLADFTHPFKGDIPAGDSPTNGLVPAPLPGDGTKFLKGDGTWSSVSGSGFITSVTAPLVVTSGDLSINPATTSNPGVVVINDIYTNPPSHTDATTSFFVTQAIGAAITSGKSFRGSFDASGNLFPSSNGSGPIGSIAAGDFWVIIVAGTLGGVPVSPNDTVLALVNIPGQTSSNWTINSASVFSVFGRTGNIIAVAGDYNISQITNGLSNILASAFIFVGNGSGIATGVSMTGDVSITNTGVTSVVSLPAISGANLTNLNASNIASGTISNAFTTATSTNTASTIVLRSPAGNFIAGTITASLTGVASLATSLTGITVNSIPFQSASSVTSYIAPVNSAVLATNGSGVPSLVTTLPGVNSGSTVVTDPTTASIAALNLALSNILAASGGTGTVTSVSVVSANGFTGTVATPSTTPAITISTNVTGILYGNGTALSAAVSGTDYSAGTSGLTTGILKSTTTTGALTIAVAADFPILNQNTTGNATTATKSTNLAGTTVNSIPFQSASATTGYISPVNSAVLATNGLGLPSLVTTLPGVNSGSTVVTDPTTFSGNYLNSTLSNIFSSINGITSLTGDVTGTGPGATATTISLNAVTFSKFQKISQNTILGNPTGSISDITTITLNSSGNLVFSGLTLNTAQDIKITSSPTFSGLSLSNGGFYTQINQTLTGNRIFKLPDFNTNSIVPLSSFTANKFLTYIDNNGIQNLDVPFLRGLGDVNLNKLPSTNEKLSYDGNNWINEKENILSGSSGINFYFSTPIILNKNSNNDIMLNTLNINPETNSQEYSVSFINNNTVICCAFLYPNQLKKYSISSGYWGAKLFVSVDNISNSRVTTITTNTFRVISGQTITTTGTGTTRIANSTGYSFVNSVASSVSKDASYLQTNQGLYQIITKISSSQVLISVPSVYPNQTNVSCSVWNKLFQLDSDSITCVYPYFYIKEFGQMQPSFYVNQTDYIGIMTFATSNNITQLNLAYNGTIHNSFMTSPLDLLHNNLSGLDGGNSSTGYYHLSLPQYNFIPATALTQGSIAIWNSNLLTQDNENFFWDYSNKRLGIRVNQPLSPLHVYQKITDNPTGLLLQNTTGYNNNIIFTTDNTSTTVQRNKWEFGLRGSVGSPNNTMYAYCVTANNAVGCGWVYVIDGATGNMAVGTNVIDTTYKFSVNGAIRSLANCVIGETGASRQATLGLTLESTNNNTYSGNQNATSTNRTLSLSNPSSNPSTYVDLCFMTSTYSGSQASLDMKFVRSGTGGASNFIFTYGVNSVFTDLFKFGSNNSAYKTGGGSWTDISDERTKKNITPIKGALDKICQLNGVYFNWKNPNAHYNIESKVGGFIAQEVEKVFPNWIKEEEPSENEDKILIDDNKLKSLTLPFEYDALIVQCIKELRDEIFSLKEEINKLKTGV
jgi:hypothetical protein